MDQMDQVGLEEGNTNSSNPKKKLRVSMGKHWCFTDHNVSKEHLDQMDQVFTSLGASWLHGLETCPTTGKEHRQGFISFQNKCRPIEKCRDLTISHWEKCKGSKSQNIEYVTKEGKDIQGNIQYDEPLRLISEGQFYTWQAQLVNELRCTPDDRTIKWIWEAEGKVGKTTLAKWMAVHLHACVAEGKANDVKNRIITWKKETGAWPKIVIWDLARSLEQFVSYQAIESVKNGFFYSGKYEGGECIMNCPHVVVFANFEPDIYKMSMDRFDINAL